MGRKKVYLIGGVALAINGYPNTVCRLHNSNEGFFEVTIGGVARNVAYHLAKYDFADVHLVSCIGTDDYRSKIIREDCWKNNILTDHFLFADRPSASYISIFDEDFDLVTGISSMNIIHEMTPDYFGGLLPVLNGGDLVLIDSNVSPESIQFLLEHLTVPSYYEPVSVAKSRCIGKNVGLCHTIKANRFEAAQISGCSCDTERGAYRAAEWFMNEGVQQLFITLGSDGVLYSTPDTCGIIEGEKVEVADSSNAGDCLSAGVIYSMLQGKSAEECARFGNHQAALFCQSKIGRDYHYNILD